MPEPLLRVENLNKRFGALPASDDLSLDLDAREIHAVIGPNGAGKTTLVAQLGGQLLPDDGRILLDGRDITDATPESRTRAGIARSFQITSVFPEFTAEDNVALAVQGASGHSFSFWQAAATDERLRGPAREALDQVGLAGRAATTVSNLSHGEQRQLEIAMALATSPRVLLLDEPMAGMGPEESATMTALLATLKQDYAILLVEHDMDVVFALADRITVLVYGRAIATGRPDEIRADVEVRQAYLGESA